MFDTERFIREVEQRPALYDVQSKDYGSREMKAKCWSEIGEAVYADWISMSRAMKNVKGKEMIVKWKAIRDNFVKDHKRVVATKTGKPATKRKRYVYHKQLQFLLPYIRGTMNNCSLTESPAVQEQDDDTTSSASGGSDIEGSSLESVTSMSVVPCNRNTDDQQCRVNSKSTVENSMNASTRDWTVLYDSIALQKDQKTDIYGHKAFLMSYLPILNSLPLNLALQARLAISKAITDFLACSTEDSSTSS